MANKMKEDNLKINSNNRLIKNSTKSDKVILFIPGISGDAFMDEFSWFYQECERKGFDILKTKYWKNADDLNNKKIVEIFDEIDNAVNFLISQKYSQIFAVGKSFGATMLLLRNHPKIKRMVLWSPVIGFNQKSSNFEELKNISFSKIFSLNEIKVSPEFISEIKIPVKIISGQKDKISLIENIRKIISYLKNGQIEEISEMEHSFSPKNKEIVAKQTTDFLIKK